MQLIDGKVIAGQILSEVKAQVAELGIEPKLVIVRANDDAASEKFVELKLRRAGEVGIMAEQIVFSAEVTLEELKATLTKIARDEQVTAIILQLPLFPHLKDHTQELLDIIPLHKDADGLTSLNAQRLEKDWTTSTLPAAVAAVLECIKSISNQELEVYLSGKEVAIVNDSILVGQPLSHILRQIGAEVTVVNKFTDNIPQITSAADIIVTATGQPGLITDKYCKQGAVVIDVGSPVGDVAVTPDLESKIAYLTPVPGGVGPVTVACLLRSCIAAITNHK